MTSALTALPPAAPAPSLPAQLAALRDRAAAKPPAAKTAPTEVTPDPAAQAETQRRQAAKDHAKQRVLALVEQIKTIKQFASDQPEIMAKQLARIAKELKSALAAYAQAGGRGGAGWAGALSPAPAAAATPDPSSPPPSTSDTYRQMRDRVAGSEIAGDMDLVNQAKGIAETIRDLLTKAKIQKGVAGPGDEMKRDIDDTEATLKEVGKALDDMSTAIRATSPEAGLFVALYA